MNEQVDQSTVQLLGELCELHDRLPGDKRTHFYLHFTRQGAALLEHRIGTDTVSLFQYYQFSDEGWQGHLRQDLRDKKAAMTNPYFHFPYGQR